MIRRWPSLAMLAASLLQDFESGDVTMAWSHCTEIIDDENAPTLPQTRVFVDNRPELTHDSRVDALMAAFAEWICVEKHLHTPLWTVEHRVCAPFWFLNSLPVFRALAMVESPPSFASRGIFVCRHDLITV